MRPLLPLAAALAACHGTCGSTQGLLHGTVSNDHGGAVTVAAYDATSHALITRTEAGEDGGWELHVEGGQTVIVNAVADAGGDETGGVGGTTCYSEDVEVKVRACQEEQVDLIIGADCISADKPNLYLYPEKDTPTSVVLHHDPRQVVFASAPPYGPRGWTGTAHPDGTFTPADGDTAPFLFYEITLLPAQVRRLQTQASWCLQGDGAVDALAAALTRWGFTDREAADFAAGWVDDLPYRPTYRVSPQRRVDPYVRVEITPSLPLERLWLLIENGRGCTPAAAPAMSPLRREGPHAAEWGVVLRGL